MAKQGYASTFTDYCTMPSDWYCVRVRPWRPVTASYEQLTHIHLKWKKLDVEDRVYGSDVNPQYNHTWCGQGCWLTLVLVLECPQTPCWRDIMSLINWCESNCLEPFVSCLRRLSILAGVSLDSAWSSQVSTNYSCQETSFNRERNWRRERKCVQFCVSLGSSLVKNAFVSHWGCTVLRCSSLHSEEGVAKEYWCRCCSDAAAESSLAPFSSLSRTWHHVSSHSLHHMLTRLQTCNDIVSRTGDSLWAFFERD